MSFAESYRGLFDWAHQHGLPGIWAAAWPLQVDMFIAVSELALFVALADASARRSRIGAWLGDRDRAGRLPSPGTSATSTGTRWPAG